MSDTRLIDFGEIPEHIERPVPSSRRQVLCSFFSAMLPGVGFWFLGARTKAVITLGLFLLVFSMFWPMGLTRNYVIWIVCSCGLIVVYLAGAGLTLLSTTPL